ncbi:MAG: DNA repair and recombination protein RadA [Candidatus Nitrosopolaris sp.]
MSRSISSMSQTAANTRLEDLDIKPYIITKLKMAGIQSVFDLAISIPHQLVDINNGMLTGTNEQVALELVTKAKKALIDSGLLFKDFSTAEQILERRRNLLKCTTGSARLDSFLKGGIETQAITEIAGEFGTGKSQICYTLCVTANTPLDRKGLGGNVIFIDTENTFRAERIFQIAEHRGTNDPDEILRKIYVCKIYNTSHLEVIIQDLGKSIEEYNAKLVIVDSIIALHRAEFTGRGTLADRQQRLNIMLHKLNRLAEVHNIAVVITNQVQSQPDDFSAGRDGLRATGGNIMGHASTYRILLRKAGSTRIAIMIDSPCHAYDQTKFMIAEGGVVGCSRT